MRMASIGRVSVPPIRHFFAVVLGLAALAVAGPSHSQQAPEPDRAAKADAGPAAVGKPPGSFKPDADETQPDVWIFSGELQGSRETFSGTLVAQKGSAQFELKLAGGATCDGSDLSGDVGLVRLSEINCSDDRTMRALFVPQGGQELKVFGHVGDERFTASAHLLGTEPLPERKQTAEPTAPALQGRPGEPGPRGPAGRSPGAGAPSAK